MLNFDLNNLKQPIEPEQSKPLVILVDDEIEALKVFKLLLADKYDIRCAQSGAEALDIIDALDDAKQIQLVISDQRMNYMTGLELFNKVNQIIPDTMFMLVSGTINTQQIQNTSNKSGVFSLVTKPIDPREFLLLVQKNIDSYQQRQALLRQYQALTLDIQVISEQLTDKKRQLEQTRAALGLKPS